MKKTSLFTFILVLMMVSAFNVFADDNANSSSQTEISEEVTTEATENNQDATSEEEKEQKKSYGVVSEYELNLAKLAREEAESQGQSLSNQEQDSIKVKKLNAVKAFIKSKNNKLNDAVVTKVAEAAISASDKHQFDLSMILAVMWKESTFNPNVYNTYCYGVMQIHQNTAAGFGYKIADIKDPYKAADLGTKILKGHIKNYNNTIIGLTAYNQGTGNVNRGNYNTRYANNVVKKQAVIQSYLNKALS
ncbi:MAG: transglycosylase SLT domain-containing protein [Peptostreptococcaceae bacterium]|nr:transglycosylase SLT domain-containing protein [Peptostreptococcaceae bacterium]